MSIYDNLYEEMKSAMKAKDQNRVLLLRGLIANIKNATVNAGKEITDDIVLSCIKKNIKELDQSIESFSKANRSDEVDHLNLDKIYLSKFLPKQMSEDELKVLIANVVLSLNATSKKDMGKVMKEVMKQTHGLADGKIVSSLVAKVLN